MNCSKQYFDWVLLYSTDVNYDNLCIAGWIYFCKRVQEVYSFSLADIYFLALR